MKPTAMVYRASSRFSSTARGAPWPISSTAATAASFVSQVSSTSPPPSIFVETVDLLTSVYFYDLIEIQISSLGGVSTALEHYLAAHERWRAAGVRVRTRVVDRAASAAALLLSLGDERIAEPGAAPRLPLAFRVCSDAPVTATAAAVLFSDLADLDDRFLARLVDRGPRRRRGDDRPRRGRLRSPRPRPAHGRAARGCETPPAHGARARPAARASGAPRDSREGSHRVLAAIYKSLCRSEVADLPGRRPHPCGSSTTSAALRLRPPRAASAPGLVGPRVAVALPRRGCRSARGTHPPHPRPRRYRVGQNAVRCAPGPPRGAACATRAFRRRPRRRSEGRARAGARACCPAARAGARAVADGAQSHVRSGVVPRAAAGRRALPRGCAPHRAASALARSGPCPPACLSITRRRVIRRMPSFGIVRLRRSSSTSLPSC